MYGRGDGESEDYRASLVKTLWHRVEKTCCIHTLPTWLCSNDLVMCFPLYFNSQTLFCQTLPRKRIHWTCFNQLEVYTPHDYHPHSQFAPGPRCGSVGTTWILHTYTMHQVNGHLIQQRLDMMYTTRGERLLGTCWVGTGQLAVTWWENTLHTYTTLHRSSALVMPLEC